MSIPLTAYLSQTSVGTWCLSLSHGGSTRDDLLPTTAPGIVPSLDERATALGDLGVVPTEEVWRWQEGTASGNPRLIGLIAVRSVTPVRKRGPIAPEDLAELLGPEAAGWPALDVTVHHGGMVDPDGSQFRVFAGRRLIGFTMATARGGREYRAVFYTDREGLPYGWTVPDGLPEDPLRAEYDALRAMGKPGDPDYPTGPYVPPDDH